MPSSVCIFGISRSSPSAERMLALTIMLKVAKTAQDMVSNADVWLPRGNDAKCRLIGQIDAETVGKIDIAETCLLKLEADFIP